MKRTQQTSIDALAEAIEQQKNARDFNFVDDLKMLRKQYTKTSKRDFLALLDLLREKYTVEETAAVHARRAIWTPSGYGRSCRGRTAAERRR